MPKQVDHEARRQRIADAVCRLAARRGLEGVSLRHVAVEAGVSMGQIQHYFTTKDEMLLFALRTMSDRVERRLGAADYSLVAHGPHDLFTFCMCAGGYVMPSVSEPGAFCTNGMSLSRHDSPFANSGLVVTIPTEAFGDGDVLAGVRLQQEYERRAFAVGCHEYHCPIQRATDFLAGRPTQGVPDNSYPRGAVSAAIAELVPPLVLDALRRGLPIMDRRWHGRFLPEATLVGPEARGSAPVRIPRDDASRETPGIEGFYPVGEGAGYAGGIVSAAVDGLRTAKAIVATYAPLERRDRR